MRQPVVVFDGDCAFCTRCVGWARRIVGDQVIWLPWQQANLNDLGLNQQDCERALQWVATPGNAAGGPTEHAEGGAAVRRILRMGRQPWPIVAFVAGAPGLRQITDWAYRVVARHRHRLPGGTPACAMPSTTGQ